LKASGWPIGGKRNIKSNSFWILNSLEGNKINVNVENNARNIGKTQKVGCFKNNPRKICGTHTNGVKLGFYYSLNKVAAAI